MPPRAALEPPAIANRSGGSVAVFGMLGVGVFRAAGMTKSGNDNAGMTSILPAAGANVMAGHSLGEYTALVCAGSLDFAEAVKLVRKRGEVMQNAGGAMAAAVGIDGDSADAICAKLREQNFKVWAANYNSPQQTVIAGSAEDLARAEESFKNGGAKRFVRLQMSCASHCPLMQNAAAMMAEEFDMLTITKYSPLVLHNVSAAAAKDTDDMLQLLRRHLTEPVRWVDTVRAIVKAGIHIIYECGPGKVLTNLNKRIAADIEHIALASSADL